MAIPSETLTTVQPGRPETPGVKDSADARLAGTEARKAVKDALAIVPMIVTRIELWKTEWLVPLERSGEYEDIPRKRGRGKR